jgi:hypothetical protein
MKYLPRISLSSSIRTLQQMNRVKAFVIGCLLLFFSPRVSAQWQWRDSLNYSIRQKPKFYISVSTYFSFIDQDLARFTGFRMGLNYNKRLRFGIGYYGLSSQVVNSINVEDNNVPYTTNGELKYGFLCLSAEWIFYKDQPWQFSVLPLQFGFGSAHFEYLRVPDKQLTSTEHASVFTYEPDFTAQYTIIKWIGLGASLGYRMTVVKPKGISENFNAPTFSIGVKLFVDEIYHSAFPDGIHLKK